MDKLDYVLVVLAVAIQLLLSAGVLYLGGRGGPETTYSVTELDTKLSDIAVESGDSNATEGRRWISMARGALLGMDQQIERLRRMYRNSAILGLLVIFFAMIVIARLHFRVRKQGDGVKS